MGDPQAGNIVQPRKIPGGGAGAGLGEAQEFALVGDAVSRADREVADV